MLYVLGFIFCDELLKTEGKIKKDDYLKPRCSPEHQCVKYKFKFDER